MKRAMFTLSAESDWISSIGVSIGVTRLVSSTPEDSIIWRIGISTWFIIIGGLDLLYLEWLEERARV